MAIDTLMEKATANGISGTAFATVAEAYRAALQAAAPRDLIYVGGSTFIVADLLASLQTPTA